jgi:hypothetical protein
MEIDLLIGKGVHIKLSSATPIPANHRMSSNEEAVIMSGLSVKAVSSRGGQEQDFSPAGSIHFVKYFLGGGDSCHGFVDGEELGLHKQVATGQFELVEFPALLNDNIKSLLATFAGLK